MKRYELGALIFKCLGLFLIWGSFTSVGYVYYYVAYRNILPAGRMNGNREAFAAVALLIFGLISIFGSDHFGRWLYRYGPNEALSERLSAKQLVSVVFAGIGVCFVAIAFVGFVSDLLSFILFRAAETPGTAAFERTRIIFISASAKDLCEWLFGGWLFLKAQPLAVWWSRLREYPDLIAATGVDGQEDEFDNGGNEDRSKLR